MSQWHFALLIIVLVTSSSMLGAHLDSVGWWLVLLPISIGATALLWQGLARR